VAGVIVHAGQALNHRGNAGQRPQIRAEPMGPSALPQRPLHRAQLPRFQLRFAARAARRLQRRHTTALPLRMPPTHTLATHLQSMTDRRQTHPACCEQTGSLFAPMLQCLEITARGHVAEHASIIRQNAPFVTVLCDIQ
jgi:hypothetical protein